MSKRGWFEKQLEEVALARKNWPEWLKDSPAVIAGMPDIEIGVVTRNRRIARAVGLRGCDERDC